MAWLLLAVMAVSSLYAAARPASSPCDVRVANALAAWQAYAHELENENIKLREQTELLSEEDE